MDLKKYYDKNVIIIAEDGTIFRGFVDEYIYPEDNENEKESIVLLTKTKSLIEFYEEDIKRIIIVDDNKI